MRLHLIEIPRGAARVGPLDPKHKVDLTVVCAQKSPLLSLHSALPRNIDKQASHPSMPSLMTHALLREKHGAAPGSIETVRAFAERHGLAVVEDAPKRRLLRLSGPAVSVERAFKTRLDIFELNGTHFFAPSAPVEVPDQWQGLVEIVLGLHNSQHANPRRRSSLCCLEPFAGINDLARAYHFPEHLDARGQTIGLIEFGGGFYPEDVQNFCHSLGIRVPKISVVNVGEGGNRPASHRAIHKFIEVLSGGLSIAAGSAESDSFLAAQSTAEVTMDIEILAALAPSAHIVVYFAPGDEQGLYHALSHAIHDERYKPDVLSISWSFPEHAVSQALIDTLETLLHEAAHLGITVCASSGDGGAMNGAKDGPPSVNYPASSPYCLACGGTSGRITPAGIDEEVVWNATQFGIHGASGGGISGRFRMPAWQTGAPVPAGPDGTSGRGMPDVAGLADPRYGCEMLMAGRTFASAGTSAVAPMWAALIARINQGIGRRCGHLHPHLYAIGKAEHSGLRAILRGQNGYYQARKRWNACAGYGSPRGSELLSYFQSLSRGPN